MKSPLLTWPPPALQTPRAMISHPLFGTDAAGGGWGEERKGSPLAQSGRFFEWSLKNQYPDDGSTLRKLHEKPAECLAVTSLAQSICFLVEEHNDPSPYAGAHSDRPCSIEYYRAISLRKPNPIAFYLRIENHHLQTCFVGDGLTAHCVALSRGRGLPPFRGNRAPSPLPDVQGPERPRRAGVEAAEKVQLPSEQSWF